MWRYKIVEVSRADAKARDDLMWELGRAGWELVQVLEGSMGNAGDPAMITLFFKRSATEEIGV